MAEETSTFRAVRAARGAGTMVHRTTCKRVADGKGVDVTAEELRTWARPIKPATCCKPKLHQPVTAGWTDDPEPRASGAHPHDAAINEARDLKAAARREAENNRVERLARAKAETKAVRLWERDGKAAGQPRPDTPNLDAIAAEEAEAQRTTVGAKHVANGNGTPRAPRQSDNPRVQRTREASDACGTKRGPGKKVTDDELVEYIANYRRAYPEDTLAIAREFAYYVDKLAFNRERWAQAWAAAEAK
jgi:hypothetical protein